MKQILGFLINAMKWLARPISLVKDQGTGRYVALDDILKSIELCYYYWLALSKQYSWITKVKRGASLYELHVRIKELMANYPELREFDIRTGNPFIHLMTARSMTREQAMAKHGDTAACLNVDLILRMASIVITYNFFKRYKDRSGDLFIKAEENMKELVTEHHLPGRFSWNKSVPKAERPKEESNLEFLDIYDGNASSVSPTTDQVKEFEEPASGEKTSSAPNTSDQMKEIDEPDTGGIE
jgi:hypothetical protein